MEDIQFWLYLAFAVIYFITRGMKKKTPPKSSPKPAERGSQERPKRKPVTFEELLQEFTEGKREEEVEEMPYEEPPTEEKQRPYQAAFEEGVTRTFSDEESKAVYERSIAMAEGAELEFKQDEHFRSSIKRTSDTKEGNEIASSIKEMLQDQKKKKKAVILGEILNKRY